MDTFWNVEMTLIELIIDMAIICAMLLLGMALTKMIRPLRQYAIPACLIAGFLGLLAGPEILSLLPFDVERMGVYVYHLLALTFIAVTLRSPEKGSRAGLGFGFLSLMTNLLQAIFGIALVILLSYIIADLPLGVGMLLPLGFAMGPGLAFSIGQSWEPSGFVGAGTTGLTMAALGFLAAYTVGLVIGGVSKTEIGPEAKPTTEVNADSSRVDPDHIDSYTVGVANIIVLYLATWLAAHGLELFLSSVGLGSQSNLVWSFHFLVAIGVTSIYRVLIGRLAPAMLPRASVTDSLASLFVDLLVPASIMGISIVVLSTYWIPVVLLAVGGTVLTALFLRWSISRTFKSEQDLRLKGIFGQMTGTLSSGLALVRMGDPGMKTTVARELAQGSAYTLVLGFPLLLLINLPYATFGGSTQGFLIVAGGCTLYFFLAMAAWWRLFVRHA